jgi:hypothetical protein
MILKIHKANGSGWILRDSLSKIRYNTSDFKIRLKNKPLEPQDYDVYDTVDGSIFGILDLDALELDFKGYDKPQEDIPCVLITASIEGADKDVMILANTAIYILNDNGKTIESL